MNNDDEIVTRADRLVHARELKQSLPTTTGPAGLTWAECVELARGAPRPNPLGAETISSIKYSQQERCCTCAKHERFMVSDLEMSHLLSHHEAHALRHWLNALWPLDLAREPENFVGECPHDNGRRQGESFDQDHAWQAWHLPFGYARFPGLRRDQCSAIIRTLRHLDEIRAPVHRVSPRTPAELFDIARGHIADRDELDIMTDPSDVARHIQEIREQQTRHKT
jgi:hypothetical protein